ncbi:4Fe-4S binding protein, partial [candidate division WOR-3 bacterium]|nr:4Fe-4S binding protein [candidate division WOR-3 bacterium]
EYNPDIVTEILSEVFKIKNPLSKPRKVKIQLPSRPPILCPGCSHRATYYAAKKASPKETIYPSDIGCYGLGKAPPLEMGDLLLCMGSNAGTACGLAVATDEKVISFMGDSTFFHSGITGLVNAVYNKGNLNLIILDNFTTAMTGHQPHPGTGKLARGEQGKRIPPEEIARGCGVELVRVVNPNDLKATEAAIKEALSYIGVAVLIFRRPCALLVKPRTPYRIDPELCNGCRLCLHIGCPAISLFSPRDREKPLAVVDEVLCVGCGLCVQLCQRDAIVLTEKSDA